MLNEFLAALPNPIDNHKEVQGIMSVLLSGSHYELYAWSVSVYLLGIFFSLSDWGSRLISWNTDSRHINSCVRVKIKFSPKTQINPYKAGSHNVNIQCMPRDRMDSRVTLASWAPPQIPRSCPVYQWLDCGERAWILEWANTREVFMTPRMH